MPVYEFYCRKCKLAFTEVMHVTEHDEHVPECPRCHDRAEVEKQFSVFTPATARKS